MAGNAKRDDPGRSFCSEEYQVEMETKETKIRILEEQVNVSLRRVLGMFASAFACLTYLFYAKTPNPIYFSTTMPRSSEQGRTLLLYT